MRKRLWFWPGAISARATIHDIPETLLEVFMKIVVWPKYPGGVAEAIMDLMRQAVEEKAEKSK